MCVHVIDSNILLCVRINGGHPARSNLRQPFQLFRGHIPRPCVRIPVCFKKVCKCGTDEPGDLAHAHMQTRSQAVVPTPIGTCTNTCLPSQKHMHTQEITFKSMRQLVTHTHSHVHTPSINLLCLIFLPYPSGPCLPPHVEQVGNRQTKVSGGLPHTHKHTHTCRLSLALFPFPLSTPPLNDHRYVKKLCHLKQQPLSAT